MDATFVHRETSKEVDYSLDCCKTKIQEIWLCPHLVS